MVLDKFDVSKQRDWVLDAVKSKGRVFGSSGKDAWDFGIYQKHYHDEIVARRAARASKSGDDGTRRAIEPGLSCIRWCGV